MEKIKPIVYCGACECEMRRISPNVFGCSVCGASFESFPENEV